MPRSLVRSALNPSMASSRSSVSCAFWRVTALIRLASLSCLSLSRTIFSAPSRNILAAELNAGVLLLVRLA